MKNTSMKNTLLIAVILLIISMVLVSCEQQDMLNNSAETPLDIELVSENIDMDERSVPSCWCQHRGASRRSSSSSYVYCYGYDGLDKTYILADEQGNVLQTKYSQIYFVYFTGLQSGKKYRYRTYTSCNRPRYSPWTYFTQDY